MSSYQASILARRIRTTRRRALAILCSGSVAAAVAACSGDSDSGSGSSTSSPAGDTGLGVRSTTTATAKPGGILKIATAADADSLDPHTGKAAISTSIGLYSYNKLVKFKAGQGAFADGTVESDGAAAWEQPDPTTVIFRLRDTLKFDPRSPTSGRKATAEDVVVSWQKFAAESVFRNNLFNGVNPNAPVSAVRAIDDATVEIKTAFADASLLPALGFNFGLFVVPKEAYNGGYNAQTEMRGGGPWMLDRYERSAGFFFKKNPSYYGQPSEPLVDELHLLVIPNTAQASAQFKAKNVFLDAVPPVDILSFNKDLNDTSIILDAPDFGGMTVAFSWRENWPFRDKRVRQAMSMLIDRDTYIDVFYDVSNFQKAGADMGKYWTTPLGAGYGPAWLDPKSETFGPSAKNYHFNVAEAKKLLTAAGYPDGFTTPFAFVSGPEYGRDWSQRAEMMMQMLGQGGIECTPTPVDYTTVYLPKYVRSKGDVDGLFTTPVGSRMDPGLLWKEFWVSAEGPSLSQVGNQFPELDALYIKQRGEFDASKRREVFHEFQRFSAENIPVIPTGSSELVSLVWNGVRGPGELFAWANQNRQAETFPRYWLEDSLRS